MTKAELKQLHADARKLVKILGSRPAPPVRELEQRYHEVMIPEWTRQLDRTRAAVLARRDRGDQ